MIVTANFIVPEKYSNDMKQAIYDGDYSWIREILDCCDLMSADVHG